METARRRSPRRSRETGAASRNLVMFFAMMFLMFLLANIGDFHIGFHGDFHNGFHDEFHNEFHHDFLTIQISPIDSRAARLREPFSASAALSPHGHRVAFR